MSQPITTPAGWHADPDGVVDLIRQYAGRPESGRLGRDGRRVRRAEGHRPGVDRTARRAVL